MKVEVKLEGLRGAMDTLKQLPPEIVSKRGGPVRGALRKGAVVIHKQELANLERVTANEPSFSTGLLLKNVVITRGKAPFGGKGERMLIRVRRKVYPADGRSPKSPRTTLAAANLLEYGSSTQRAEPFIRPAFLSKASEAIEVASADLKRRIDLIVRKLAAQNKGK